MTWDGTLTTANTLVVAIKAFRGLQIVSNAPVITATSKATGNVAGANAADSGTSAGTTTNANGLKLGFYGDDGWNRTIDAGTLDTTYTMGPKNDVDTDMEIALEWADSGAAGSTARATCTISGAGNPLWGMAVFVAEIAGGAAATSTLSLQFLGL